MTLFVIALLSGMLTVLAPCILPVLPVVLGTTTLGRHSHTPFVVIVSLSLSIIVFSLLIKTTALFFVISPEMWRIIAGVIFAGFGIALLFPSLWSRLPIVGKAERFFMQRGNQKESLLGPVLTGIALGPIFTTCSPTYFVILGTILPVSFSLGVFYLGVYVLGLALMLALIAYAGNRYLSTFVRLSNPQGALKRTIGVLFIMLGGAIAFGLMAQFEVWLIEVLPFDVTRIEHMLLTQFFYD